MPAPRVEIEYCTQCRFVLRATWMAQELLMSFPAELGEVSLIPGTGGAFEVRLDGEVLHSRLATHGFPESRRLKEQIRDRIAPDRSLGHKRR